MAPAPGGGRLRLRHQWAATPCVRGPPLREVALASDPLFDIRRRKERSRFTLTVSGGEGHRTVPARAEIDADFGDAPVLLATRLDGEDLDAVGSQLVVPVDRCGARYISAVTRVRVGAWPGAW